MLESQKMEVTLANFLGDLEQFIKKGQNVLSGERVTHVSFSFEKLNFDAYSACGLFMPGLSTIIETKSKINFSIFSCFQTQNTST